MKNAPFAPGAGPFIVLCAFATAVAWIGIAGNFPLNDDWSFSRGARTLAEGHFHPTDWTAMTMFGQSIVGAAIIKLAGWRHDALRVGTLLFAALCLLTLFGFAGPRQRRDWVVPLVVAAVAFNPLFLLLSMSFLTDIYFFAYFLLSALFFVKALESDRAAYVHAAVVFAVLATLTRQPGILLPLTFAHVMLTRDRSGARAVWLAWWPLLATAVCVMTYDTALWMSGGLPHAYNIFILRALEYLTAVLRPGAGEPPGILASIFFYGPCLAIPFATVAISSLGRRVRGERVPGREAFWWIAAAAIVVGVWVVTTIHLPPIIQRGFRQQGDLALYFALYSLPALIALGWGVDWKRAHNLWAPLALGLALVTAVKLVGGHYGQLPVSIGNFFVGPFTIPVVSGSAPTPLPKTLWLVIEVAAMAALAVTPVVVRATMRRVAAAGLGPSSPWDVRTPHARGTLFLLILALLYYLLISLTGIHDRYVIPLVMLLACLVIRYWLPEAPRMPAARWGRAGVVAVTVLVPGVLWSGAVRDYMNWNRARWELIDSALKGGVVAKDISGGFEFDGEYLYDPDRLLECVVVRGRKACHIANSLPMPADLSALRAYALTIGSPIGRQPIDERRVRWSFGGTSSVVLSKSAP